jgi:hypothetical protein
LGRSRTVRRRCCGCIAAGLVEQFPVIYRPSVVDFFRLFLVVDLLHQKLDHFGWLWFQNSGGVWFGVLKFNKQCSTFVLFDKKFPILD